MDMWKAPAGMEIDWRLPVRGFMPNGTGDALDVIPGLGIADEPGCPNGAGNRLLYVGGGWLLKCKITIYGSCHVAELAYAQVHRTI